MFYEKRPQLFQNYHHIRNHFLAHPNQLEELEFYATRLVNEILCQNYAEFERDYNEASYLNALWSNYPPDERGRSPVGDQIPWIEVGEHAIGHKLSRLISEKYHIEEVGLPSGADNRFVLYSDEISQITQGETDCIFVFLDIKSVGPRDNFDHIVISPYQASGDGLWDSPEHNMVNTPVLAQGERASHLFYPALSPIYPLTNEHTAPVVHLFVKPIYTMLNSTAPARQGQPLESVKTVCVPNGLLLSVNPNYLNLFPGLFFPGKDDRNKSPRKIRVRVSFEKLIQIASWRISEFSPQLLVTT